MKVILTDETKKYITLAEAPVMRQIIADMKEDEYTAKDYAVIAARAITNNNNVKVLEAHAEICKDSSVYNRYTENSGYLDIAIKFTAMVNNACFIVATTLLSGILDIGNDKEENKHIIDRWYVRKFVEV